MVLIYPTSVKDAGERCDGMAVPVYSRSLERRMLRWSLLDGSCLYAGLNAVRFCLGDLCWFCADFQLRVISTLAASSYQTYCGHFLNA